MHDVLLPRRPILSMHGVVGTVKLDDVFLALGQVWRIWFTGAEARKIFLGGLGLSAAEMSADGIKV